MGSTKVSSPTPPAQPSTADAVTSWVNSMPRVFAEQQRQAPLEAQQQIDLATQYAQPYGQAMKTAQEAMYPEETRIKNQLLAQAQEGMTSQVPAWMQDQYRSNLAAGLGSNVSSPIGQDYMSRGLLQQQNDWQRYYQDMGQSLIGSQPTYQANQPATSNYMSGFTPQSVMNYGAQNYGTYMGGYSSMYGANAQLRQNVNTINQGYAKMGLQGVGSMMGGS